MTSEKELDEAWIGWLKENLQRECDPIDLMQTLRKNGFSLDSIRKHMGVSFPMHMLSAFRPDYRAIANVRITSSKDSPAVKVPSSKVQIYTLDNFMSFEECDRIVDISSHVLRPSTVTTNDRSYRTSSTSDLSTLHHPEIEALDEKIARALGIKLAFSEAIQAQRYEVGQEFRKHTDYFQPHTREYADFAGNRGQRTWTFMVYLNDGMTGGGTRFFELEKTFIPKKGMAVIWNNLHPDGTVNPDTLHAGLPVESGHKIIITKWFRDKGGTGSMFY